MSFSYALYHCAKLAFIFSIAIAIAIKQVPTFPVMSRFHLMENAFKLYNFLQIMKMYLTSHRLARYSL